MTKSAPGKRYKVIVEVIEIRGHCPVYRVGDRMTITMPFLDLENTDRVCIHALVAIQTLVQALARGYSAKELGIGDRDDEGYAQCPDPGPPYTRGGTVVFRLRREEAD